MDVKILHVYVFNYSVMIAFELIVLVICKFIGYRRAEKLYL